MNRRHALSVLAAVPFAAARLNADTRSTAKTRVVLAPSHGLLFQPGGTIESWSMLADPRTRRRMHWAWGITGHIHSSRWAPFGDSPTLLLPPQAATARSLCSPTAG